MTIRQAYIAASYTAPTRTQTLHNITAALVAGIVLAKAGIHPICPHAMGSHRSDWEPAMVKCRAIIRELNPEYDCLVMLEGWEKSQGASEERELALSLGIPVMNLAEVLGEASHVHHV